MPSRIKCSFWRHGDIAASLMIAEATGVPPNRGRATTWTPTPTISQRWCGTPIAAFDELRAKVLADRSQFFMDLSMPFYGYNRPGAKISEGVRESFWLQGMMASMPAAYFCIKAFSETDMTED